ncbi:MAG: tRNA pseudouridine(55) synthase TruB [Chloroflexi bacterium]|nr:tRNA pseudouridine(55) synthase TruB [Chloroflexota bacterium]
MGVNGLLNVNKPPGCTSFSIVARVRRLSGERRVGHAGTLDPAASGVLPVCLGQATRVAEYLLECPKEYVAGIELGISTDTYDGEGRVTGRGSPHNISLSSVEDALQTFEGAIDQVPPAFSAVKVGGRKSYDLARAGIQVELQPRRVRIDSIEVMSFDLPYLKLRISCSKGTYIRSLANDLGQSLGCYAYLKDLVRTSYGPFKIDAAVTPDQLQKAAAEGGIDRWLYPLDCALPGSDRVYLEESQALSVKKGLDIPLGIQSPCSQGHRCAYTADGRLLAVMKFVTENGLWHPEKVFNL